MKEQRFAILTAVTTFLLLLVGGIVHGTGSSLACPDWPTCFGTLMPEMKGGVFYEHSHRLLASLVGLFTIILAVLVWRRRQSRRLRIWAVSGVGLVIFQGVLGGITVIYKLPTAVSSTHLAVSMLFFTWTIVMSFLLAGGEPELGSNPPQKELPYERRWILGTGILVYLQIVLGAVVRHTHAGLACIELPFCKGSLWPSGVHGLIKLHMAHRIGGVLVALAVFGLAVYLLRRAEEIAPVRILAGTAPFLVVAQVTLGLLSVSTYLSLWAVTAHLGGGALLLALMVCLWMFSRRAAEAVPLS